MSSAPTKPKAKRRWWIRLLRVALLLLLLFVLLLSGSFWWAYSKRVYLLNNALADAGPLQGTVGSFEITRTGGIEMHDLVFTDRATGAVLAKISQVSGEANLTKLPPDEIRILNLKDAQITLSAAMIESWRKLASAPPAVGSAAPPIPFGIRFSKVNIENARVRFEWPDGSIAEAQLNFNGKDFSVQPTGLTMGEMSLQNTHARLQQAGGASTEVKLQYHGEGVRVQPDGISTGDQEITIEEGAVKASDGAAPFDLQKLRVKGRVHDGMVEVADIELDRPSLRMTPALLAMFGLTFPSGNVSSATPSNPNAAPIAAAPAVPSPALVRGVRIENVRLRDANLNIRGFAVANSSGLTFPDTQAQVSYEAHGLEWHVGSEPAAAVQKVSFREVNIEAPNNGGHLRFASASMDVGQLNKQTQWVIGALRLDGPDIGWTTQLRKLLTGQAGDTKASPDANSPQAGTPPQAASASPALLVGDATITNANVVIADPEVMPFDLSTRGSIMLANLLIDAKGLHSQSFQTIEVTETKLVFPTPKDGAAKKPWLELPHGEVVVKPDDWNEHTRIAKLALDKIVVRMRDGNTPWDSSQPAVQVSQSAPITPAPQQTENQEPRTKNQEPATENREPRTENLPWWKLINCGQLTVNEGTVDLLMNAPKPVDLQAQVDITTQRRDDGGSQHTVRVAHLTTRLPTLSPTPFPVVQADLVEGVVRLPEMWTQRRFDELHLTGASVDLSEALLKLFEPDKQAEVANTTPPASKPEEPVAATPPPLPAANPQSAIRNPQSEPSGARQTAEGSPKGEAGGPNQSPWQVGLLSVNNSSVTVTNLVPGLPAVKFGLSLEVKDTPLLAEDLAQSVASQRIELHDLKIPSPNGTARYVAELDSIFVTFSLGGLMRKEIDGIEIVSPTLFVGEDLFWYVDFYRKYAERGSQPAPKGPEVAANDANLNLELANAVTAAEPAASQASWSVKRLQVHSGKLVLAPKGVPLKGFHTPFPFHIDSEVTRGTLNADMEIPADTYELPDVNLQFVGMTGKVQFNLPLKQKDNNLVETFEVDSIRWKGIRTGKAFLSVTYDSAGIYSKFGAKAYDGYLNGEFNVYTDDSFHWDGWVGGKDVQMHDLTRVLCPGYFIMDGSVQATLVAQGSKDELYQADGSFKNHTPGTFTIKALNGLIKDLPKSFEPLNAQIAKIGLETLRDFKYDHAEMKCRFYGREGNGTLQFSGPNGSRNFDINVYDHRWKTDEPGTVITSSGTVKDQTNE